nr:hypothetical protein [Brevibacillus laterosporus]
MSSFEVNYSVFGVARYDSKVHVRAENESAAHDNALKVLSGCVTEGQLISIVLVHRE